MLFEVQFNHDGENKPLQFLMAQLLIHDEERPHAMEVVSGSWTRQIKCKVTHICSFADIRDVSEAVLIMGELRQDSCVALATDVFVL